MAIEHYADNILASVSNYGVDSGCCCFRARRPQTIGHRTFACRVAGHRTCALHLYLDVEGGAHCYTCMEATSDRPAEGVMTYGITDGGYGTNDRPTVVIVPHALHMCGAARHCLELSKEFFDRGFRVTIVAVQGGGHWGHKFLQVADEVILGTRSMTWDDIVNVMGRLDPAFVTAHYDPAIEWALRNVPMSVPMFAHFHTELVPSSAVIELLADATRRCRRVFFPSVQTLHQYRELLSVPEPDGLAVMPNALPCALSDARVAAGNPRRDDGDTPRKRLAVVSRLDPDKFSIPLFIATVRALRDVVPSVAVQVAGTGESEAMVRRASRDAGLDEFVDFLGYVEDIVDVYKSSDAVFVPSYTEAMPYTAIEAAAIGVPCVLPGIGYFAGPVPDLSGVATFKPEDHKGAVKLLRSAIMREPPFDRIHELPLALSHESWSRRVALSYELDDYLDPLDRPCQANPGLPL